MGLPKVSVITPTRSRTTELLRAVRSVASQDHVHVEHIIVGDSHSGLEMSGQLKEQILQINPRARIFNISTAHDIVYSAQRTAAARNFGIKQASGEYIAHLDDDNAYEPDHLSSLVHAVLKSDAGIAYSWRKLINPDGSPHFVDKYPWSVPQYLRDFMFRNFIESGIFIPGSNEIHDVMVTPKGDAVLHVDTSEWLISKRVHERYPFRTEYSLRQMLQAQTEDYVLAKDFFENGIAAVCTGQASLLYYMGGYSNRP